MSRATIRGAVLNYLDGQVDGITTTYRAVPKVIPATAFAPTGTPGGAIAAVYIPNVTERRIALGGATSGWKQVRYTVDILLLHRWTGRADVGGDAALDAQDNLDTIIDNLKALIRANRTLNSTAVWEAGEAELADRQAEPRLTGDIVETWAAVSCLVVESVQT